MPWNAQMQDPVTTVPEGEYSAVLTAVDEQPAMHGPVNKYEFRLEGSEEIDGRKVTGLTSTVMAENTKKGRWIAALVGRVPDIGEKISERDVLNNPCRVVIAHKTDARGIVHANVVDVLPPEIPGDEAR